MTFSSAPLPTTGTLPCAGGIRKKDTMAEAVPELRETVAREKTWRALILTTGEGLTYRNPFDLVPFEPPQKEWEEPLEENICPGCVR